MDPANPEVCRPSSPREQPTLRVRTEEITLPRGITDQMVAASSAAWVHSGDGLIGYGEAARYAPVTIADADRWWHAVARRALVERDLEAAPAGSGLIAFGSFVFDPDHTSGQSVLSIPEVAIGCRNGRAWRTTIRNLDTNTEDGNTPGPAPDGRPPGVAGAVDPGMVRYADGALSGPAWERAVASAVDRIQHDRLAKVVLARELIAATDRPVDPGRLLTTLAADHPRCWTYQVDGLVGATPEMLIRRENGLATSRVLAGTIRRSGGRGQDLALAAALSQSGKDLAEHRYAVASVAEALGPYCSGMNVPDAPSLLELPNVFHLATDVTAAVEDRVGSLTLAGALHPSAAVCGTPTAAARATIAELEQLDRDRYAGPVGWIDAAGDGEWGIALRGGKIDPSDPRQIRLYAGCGIVADSDPEAELAESNAKLLVMREAVER